MSEVAKRLADHLHPRLAALRDDPRGEPAFWEDIARDRAPLIGPDASPGYSVVTYVFALPEGASYAAVNPGFGDARDNVMDRIAGTNVCHAAYRCRNDLRTTYGFSLDIPLTPYAEASEADMAAMMAYVRGHVPIPDPHPRDHYLIRYGGFRPDEDTSVLSLPDAPDQSSVSFRKEVPRGATELHMFRSDILGNERRVWVYLPPDYSPTADEPYPCSLPSTAARP
jgi:enterochelin esterase family protein